MATATPTRRPPVSKAPTRALHLWHLLSLDAPTVATLWTWFVARTVSVRLPVSGLAAMFLAVWVLYAADRLLDSRQLLLNPLHTDELQARHLFHYRHVDSFLAGSLAASLALATLCRHLMPAALELYGVLGALLISWFLIIHARSKPDAGVGTRLPKELAVGFFFPAAVFIPTVVRRPDLRLELLPHALLFAAVCSLNCLAIYAWEHPARARTINAGAHWTTRLAIPHLTGLAAGIALTGLVLTGVDGWGARAAAGTYLWAFALAVSLSALILLVLHRRCQHFSPLTLRAAADVALFTPLLLLWFCSGL